MQKMMIVDDESDIRTLIRFHMERAGLSVIEAESGRQAIEMMRDHQVELMILDLMMDDGNGFEVLQYLSQKDSKTIVIALSARREIQDKVDTLGLGADDYVTKPFSPIELLARVQAHLRRHRPPLPDRPEVIRLSKLVLDADNFILHNDGQRHELTQYECELLKFFMKNPDRVLTKRDIYRQVWKHENYDDNNLSVFMNRLRAMLEESAHSPRHIHTVRGVGYRFSGDGL
ncbi:response regulator transcription factor [Paenibacillus sp. GCM10027627]|uniref:response regulator transcription factor n=1 Tax=unclassified Paenibacillus TaxID=185978 RepID=UPI0036270A19